MVITTPLFIPDEDTLLVFSTVASLQMHLEAVDVRDGIFCLGYDATGQILTLSAELNLIHVDLADPPRSEPGELAKLLRRNLTALYDRWDLPPDWVSHATLEELIQDASRLSYGSKSLFQFRYPDGTPREHPRDTRTRINRK